MPTMDLLVMLAMRGGDYPKIRANPPQLPWLEQFAQRPLQHLR
jgi:hypothetical protein